MFNAANTVLSSSDVVPQTATVLSPNRYKLQPGATPISITESAMMIPADRVADRVPVVYLKIPTLPGAPVPISLTNENESDRKIKITSFSILVARRDAEEKSELKRTIAAEIKQQLSLGNEEPESQLDFDEPGLEVFGCH